MELSAKEKSTKLNDVLKLYSTINYTEDNDEKKIEEDIVFNFKNFIESLYYSEDIVELDVIENFDNEKEKPVVSKKKLTIEDFASFCTGSRHKAHNLMRTGTIDIRHFEQDSSPAVRVVVSTCNITLTFPVNGQGRNQNDYVSGASVNVKKCRPLWLADG